MGESELLAALSGAGPLGVALGAAVVVLWRALKRERDRNEELHREVIQFLKEVTHEERFAEGEEEA